MQPKLLSFQVLKQMLISKDVLLIKKQKLIEEQIIIHKKTIKQLEEVLNKINTGLIKGENSF